LAALTLTFALSAAPLAAQDIAATDDTDTVTDAELLSVIDRWQADPTTIFDASEVTLADLEYVARPLIVFANTPNDPDFIEQMRLIAARIDVLAANRVIVIIDTDPAGGSDPRTHLRPRGFSLVLMSDEGRIAQRKPAPWDVREIVRAIDKM
jgi:hypothetical protein